MSFRTIDLGSGRFSERNCHIVGRLTQGEETGTVAADFGLSRQTVWQLGAVHDRQLRYDAKRAADGSFSAIALYKRESRLGMLGILKQLGFA